NVPNEAISLTDLGGSVARKERYLVGLDVGTSKVTAVVGEILEREGLDVVGLGVAESRGIRRGVVVNLEAAVDSIKKAIEEAELMAGVEIDSVHLALSGPHIKGFNSRGVIAVAGKNREINREDVRRAIDAAKAVSLPTGRGSLWHTAVIGVGGDHFTNDIAVGLRTPVPEAEKVKRKCGCALSGMVDEDDTMEVASVGGRKPRVMARRILAEILQPRAEEIF